MLCDSLSELLNAGISIVEAVRILYFGSNRKVIKNSLYNIYFALIEGKSMYDSMKQFNDIYPYFMLEMIGVGEHSGKLADILKDLSEYYKKQYKLSVNIRSSLMYPIIVFIVSIFTVLFITSSVIPQFITTLNSIHAKVPFFTYLFISMVNEFKNNISIIIFVIFITIFFFSRYISSDQGRRKFDYLKFKIPIVKNIYNKLLISRFSLVSGILMSSGCNVVTSIEKSMNVLNNKFIEDKISKILQYINSGRGIYDSFKYEIDDLVLLYALKVGEESGNLENMLLKLGEEMQITLEYELRKLVKFIEPVSILILALFVGTFVISAILPIVNIMDSIG
ncbi:type II secretion system F family protein [Clostridium fermenticellae]|uniref:Type II secretion system F family protein n=1 Tax=Clostridium fermenticellae TaxID=2068654 RepID=A0A386H506_9CLOT|nr:type II secretion system F family protein [Clostridium fermenticellae]AYD40613.1 type II secretion system F family protein [Clostridium fermenticellae]